MSAVLEQPPAPALPAPARGSLLRAEFHRFRCRRFIQVLLGLAVLGWLGAVVIGLLNVGVPDDADYAAARAQVQQIVENENAFRERCLADPPSDVPPDLPPEMVCPPEATAANFPVEGFLPVQPFSFVQNAQPGAMGFAAAAAVLAFLIGATWIGAEWSSRNIVAQLFWEPRRLRVAGAKLVVLGLAAAVLGVGAQAGWLAMAGILSAAAGDGAPVPEGLWGDLFATGGRATLLAVFAALLGFGLANLIRNTGAALGIGFVYFAVVETAIRILRPYWQPWLLTNNAAGLVADGGLVIPIWDQRNVGPGDSWGPVEYVLTSTQAGAYLAAVTAAIVGVGVLLFARRDLQ